MPRRRDYSQVVDQGSCMESRRAVCRRAAAVFRAVKIMAQRVRLDGFIVIGSAEHSATWNIAQVLRMPIERPSSFTLQSIKFSRAALTVTANLYEAKARCEGRRRIHRCSV